MSEVILEPGRVDRNYWLDLWRYRELFQVLAWRDVAIRYKQTAIGVAWAVIRPVLTVLIFTVVFGRIAKLPSQGVPYPLLVFAGLLPWTFFSTALSDASNALVSNANLISKVYFPRLIVPVATVVAASVDFLISLAVMAAVMAWYRFAPDWRVVFLPLFALIAVLASLGPGLWITAVNVRYRDFRYVIPFLVQFGLYVSPVGFSSERDPGAMAANLRAEPDGRGDRRLPLVPAGHANRLARGRRQPGGGRGQPVDRRQPIPQAREDLRGRALRCRSKRRCPKSPSASRGSARVI